MPKISRRSMLKASGAAAGAAALPMPFVRGLAAQSRAETLVAISENGPNSLDIMGVGANRPAYEASWNIHDRLMTYGVKKDPNGNDHYDYAKLQPELAESWDIKPMSATFKLRRDAKFHDGTAVTAADVKWSFDRAVTVGGFPTFQMKAGSLEKPEQFVAVDDYTFRVDYLRKDKLTLPDLAVPVPVVINSELAKKNATATDPWAMEWLKNNEAGGGAYKVEAFRPGQEIVYVRFDEWKSGPLPKLRRIVQREVPNAGNRRALLLKGDIDITYDLPPKDFAELSKEGAAIKVTSMPIENAMFYLGLNVTKPPFDNVKLRQAVAWALPYDRMYDNALYGRGIKLYGAASGKVGSTAWPQPTAYKTDLAKAKALMAEAGFANGFETELATYVLPSYGAAVQNYLGAIGIRAKISQLQVQALIQRSQRGELPMQMGSWGSYSVNDVHMIFPVYYGGGADDYTRDPDLIKLVQEGGTTLDQDVRKRAYRQVIKIATERAYWMPMHTYVTTYGLARNVEFKAYPDELPRFFLAKWR